MPNDISYKDTLNLPKTSFPMKADLARREPGILSLWEKEKVYDTLRARRQHAPRFLLHDGPPYANGDIHMGHALNKVLKDFILKYKSLKGFDAPFVPGWDCHGLPVEHQLFKEIGKTKHEVDQVEFRRQAYDYAGRFVHIQRQQFKRLGIFGNWEDPYLTMAPAYEATIVESFLKLLQRGYVYQGTRPIHWCIHCETALAEAELEYQDHQSPSITVAFDVTQDLSKHFPGIRNPKILIWTTTPWTLPANLAVAMKPDLKYSAIRVMHAGVQRDWILASDLVASNLALLGIPKAETLGVLPGKDLEEIQYRHPFLDRTGKVVLSEFVTLEHGTGCVHIAPGHGEEDHEVGLRYNLQVLSPVNDRGVFTHEAGSFAGMQVFKANGPITDLLGQKGALIGETKIQHSYPHCWRCQNPVIFRATSQWFLSIDHDDLRSLALEWTAKTRWVPARGRNRIASMIETRPDWCLSRQRLWGVPIPAVRCAACGTGLLTIGMVERFLKSVQGSGTEVWFTQDISSWLEPGATCPKCRGSEFQREHDILDVWFDSGVSHQAVLRTRPDQSYPADLYLEGSDQHRGWFQSALLTAVSLEKTAPFRCVLTHGFVTDGEGKKMSKSDGNVIAPSEMIEKFGADVLRLWVSCVDYTDDVRLSEGIVDQVSEAYRKIRNTLRYLLGNIADFEVSKDTISYSRMNKIDQWALGELAKLIEECEVAYEAFEFYKVYRLAYDFCVLKMSAFYLDVLKDRLYTFHPDDHGRRSSQTALLEILKGLTLVFSPILAFTSEEVWSVLRDKVPGLEPSVHLERWPSLPVEYKEFCFAADWAQLLCVRNEVLKGLERFRQGKAIGSALEASVSLDADDKKLKELFSQYAAELPSLFIVSQVEIVEHKNSADTMVKSDIIPGLWIGVHKALGAKCERCWIYSTDVGRHTTHSRLCHKCVGVVEKILSGQVRS